MVLLPPHNGLRFIYLSLSSSSHKITYINKSTSISRYTSLSIDRDKDIRTRSTSMSRFSSRIWPDFWSCSSKSAKKKIFCSPEIFIDLNPEHKFLGLEI